jgi:probable F420-dependent oxidoreductase
MRVGLHVPQFREHVDAPLIREAARAAEDAGLDDVWVSDHVIVPAGSERPPESFHDALTVLTFAAAATERIGLGTSVMVAPYRHPVVLARAVASLDALSGGRVILGIASGWMRSEFAALGVPFSRRGALTDETVAACRALWRGDGSFTGATVAIDDGRITPGPARPGGPPVWIGGNSRAGMRRAARIGDAWHTTISDPEDLARRLETLAEESARAGRDEPPPVSVRVRADADGAARLAPRLAALGVVHLLVDLPGTDPGRFRDQAPRLAALRGSDPPSAPGGPAAG